MPTSTAQLIDGKAIAAQVRAELADLVAARPAGYRPPGLAVVQVGEDPASTVYVRNKKQACEAIGMRSIGHDLPETTTQDELMALVARLNQDEAVDGILVQLPLPAHLDKDAILLAIDPAKDVDGLHPYNLGLTLMGQGLFPSCTPAGVMELLARSGIAAKGRHAVVIGRSNIVGKPMAALLLAADATVTVCHSRTPDLAAVARQADILIAAVGRAGLVTAEMVKPGAVVIDVGTNRNSEGKLVGDVDFAGVSTVASWLTPVPGGVGPMTIAMLMRNTWRSYQRRVGLLGD
jgi:methylenetetrahydrofolate dehydrogenase (NADP+)/methenyltetrahydrofolate cyclohydrolase